MDEKIAHLGFIQGAINRMGGNAFLVKGWTIALVAAIFALSAKETNSYFLLVAIIPVFVFWFFDLYYLRQERLYRKLYEAVADDRVSSDKFTMDTAQVSDRVASVPCLLFSRSIFPFYALILALLVILAINTGLWANLQGIAH